MKDFITYLYTLFANDHTMEDFQFGAELLQEYIESNFSEYQAPVTPNNSSKKKKKKQAAAAQVNNEPLTQ